MGRLAGDGAPQYLAMAWLNLMRLEEHVRTRGRLGNPALARAQRGEGEGKGTGDPRLRGVHMPDSIAGFPTRVPDATKIGNYFTGRNSS